MKRTVLIAENDRQSLRLIKNVLSAAGHTVFTTDLENAAADFAAYTPEIVLLDPQYPKAKGLALIRQFRNQSDCAILAVSQNAAERTAVAVLDAGADDFLIKPLRAEELAARVRAADRRIGLLEKARGMNTADFYQCGAFTLDHQKRTVALEGRPVHLTKNEFRILALLCRYSGRVLTYDFIIRSVWGAQTDGANGILRVNITNLRKKIEQDSRHPRYLFTENGVGYRLAENQLL